MKFASSVLLLLGASHAALAFAPVHNKVRGVRNSNFMGMVSESSVTDVKIPYDAAARLSYDEWRDQFEKGNFNEDRFGIFKSNYEAITIANVVAKKVAREEGSKLPALMKLNQYGDCTEEEYKAAMSVPTTTSDVLGKALDAAQSQSEASDALKDASDALAEEEEALAKKLGLESVEELEIALDSMEGIADDGGELETDNIAREARAREAYLGWCKESKKEPDEARYPAFVENFLTMEKFAQESGKEMNLNEYADCTEEEFKAMKEKKSAPKAAPKPVAKKTQRKVEPKMDVEALRKQRKEAEEKRSVDMEEAIKKQSIVKEKMAKEQAEARAEAAKGAEDRRKEIEQEQKARQAAQEKEATKLEADAASAAIAAAKAVAEKEAVQIAKRRADAEKAGDIFREKAKEWEAKQSKLTAESSKTISSSFKAPELKLPKMPVAPPKPVAPKANVPTPPQTAPKKAAEKPNMFSFFNAPKSEPKKVVKAAPVPPKPVAPKAEAPKPVATPKVEKPKFSFFSAPAKKEAPVKKAKKEALVKKVKKEAPVKKVKAAAPAFNFFGSPAPAKKVAPAPEPVAPPAPAPKAAAPAFNFFSAPAKKAAPAPAPKPIATPAPSPTPKAAKPAFSFFGSPAPAKKAAPAPAPVAPPAPTPAPKAAMKPFSFFGSPAPVKKAAPTPEPVKLPSIKAPPSKPAFSFFGGSTAAPKKAKPEPKQTVVKAKKQTGTMSVFFGGNTVEEPEEPKRAPTFSLFGGTQSVVQKPDKVKVPNRSGTLSLFGGGGAKKAAPEKVEPEIPNRSGTLSLFQPKKKVAPAAKKASPVAKKVAAKKAVKKAAKKAAIPAGVPTLARWKQNPDGSINGFISNSPNFRDNTKITTSPIKGNASGGSVVQTGSGSKYYLQ
eukprot:CAMPEP_0198142566 /NCGR_PEP_ID=MMETSP1443-20131203/5330_1 /TAXON_ID=186043 /ORGANISM="Entomoneis sp., Strain CCMP2396" /LENGTH=891 /DNA_ID=CAMNT_0043805611 /DNA_START=110 /DNA_END=2785 /DNA_ORIENTATION=+